MNRPAEGQPVVSAAQRLALSRENLRQHMLGDSRGGSHSDSNRGENSGSERPLMDTLRAMPGVGPVVDAVSSWWAHHPLEPVASLAADVAGEALRPIVRRHPLALVGGAFLFGVVVVRARPWRWLFKRALLAGIVSQVALRAVARMPIESWVAAIAGYARTRQDSSRSATQDTGEAPAPSSHDEMAPQAYSQTPSEAEIAP